MAELNRDPDAGQRPFPPGDYPLIVIGSGPGGLQLSYALRRRGVGHAVLSADPAPGGMFRRWPFFQRLLSWTKPYAPVERGTRAYERYDWNSLLADEAELRAIQPGFMDGTSYFPSRPEMERNLVTFAERARIEVRYDCRWESTRREETQDGDRFVLGTTDGEYRAGTVVLAVGIAEPSMPPLPGIDLCAHYAETRAVETYADRRVFIIGKQNSGFELATGFLPWASRIILASPSPAKLSVNTRSLVGVRARYAQPFEDYALGGGVVVLDAAIERIEGSGAGYRAHVRPTSGTSSGEARVLEVDEVIAATGFVCPLQDLPDLGVATFGQSRLPAQTAWWESATVPGIFFAGTITQGAAGLRKHGIPANSGAVHGARYNAIVLADRLARTQFGQPAPGRPIESAEVVPFLQRELTDAPELWHQRSYLARVVTLDPDVGIADAGVMPLTAFLDEGGPDAVAVTLEADGSGDIYPAVYVRRGGAMAEHLLDPDPLLDYMGEAPARRLRDILALP